MKTISISPSDRLAVSAEEAARLLGISARHLRTLHAQGRFPHAVYLGRSVRWLRADIVRWLAAGAPNTNRQNKEVRQ